MPDASAVVVTYNALPWLEQCLESVRRCRDDRRRQRLDGRHVGFVRERFPGRARDRAGKPRSRGRLERGHGGGVRPLLPDPERRRLAHDGLARAARRVRGRAPGGGGRRPTAAQPRRHAAALRPRLPDALAARDRVLLPPQAGAAIATPERLLRGRLRPRRGAGGGLRHGRVHARAALGRRRGRPARRVVLPLQRGDRLVVPVRPGRLEDAVLPRRGVRPRRRRLARRPAAPGERARPPPLPRKAPRDCLRGAGAPPAACRSAAPRVRVSGASAGGCTGTSPTGSAPRRVPALLEQ